MRRHSTFLRATLLLGLLVAACSCPAQVGWFPVGADIMILHDVKILTATKAIAVGENTSPLATTNGGYSWEVQTAPIIADYRCVAFADPNNGVAAGEMGTIIKTTNGGTMWDSVQSGWLTTYNSAFYRPNGQFSILAGQNTLFTPLLTVSYDQWQNFGSESFYIYHNGSYNEGSVTDITETSPSLLIATCSVWDNAGAIVRKVDTVWVTAAWTPAALYALDFPTHDVGYAVGMSGQVLKSTDAGMSWNQLPFVLRLDWFGVKFVNANCGWICGENGAIYHTTDGGVNWTNQLSVGYDALYALDFSDSLHGIAVGSTGSIYVTFDGGEGNQQPTAFARISPEDSTTDPYFRVPYVLFQWQAAHDPEGGPISYNFHVYNQFFTIVDTFLTDTSLLYRIPVPILDNLVPHHWDVVANDGIRERHCSNGIGTFFINYEAADDYSGASVPRELGLSSFPNPFNPQTNLSLSLPRAGAAQLRVFNELGREVFAQHLGTLSAGQHNIVFDGHALPSGLYLAQLTTPYGRTVHKLLLMK
jgi:photosystem II stability/assembly factor-like uncharacterized protein